MSGCCASISSATVPCPAITSASSYGCTIVSDRSAARRAASAFESSKVSPVSTTSAAKPRVRSIFTVGVKRGITITAGMPSRCAW